MKNILLSVATILAVGCASHAPQNIKMTDEVNTHISRGVKVYTSQKGEEVRAALLDNTLHLLTKNGLYLYIDNKTTEPMEVSLQNLSLQRGGKNLHLRPLAEVIAVQEKLSDSALGDAHLPKIFNDIRKQTDNQMHPEIKEATAAALNAPVPAPSEDPLLDELSKEKLMNPIDAKTADQVTEAHKMIIGSLKTHYLQPIQLAPGKTLSGFVKFEQDLAPTNVPLVFKVTVGKKTHEFVLDALTH